MNYKLYVRNLSYETREAALWQLFSRSGTVISVDLIRDRVSGRSKGYAFIVMSDLLEAEKVIGLFNGYKLDGSEIRLSFVGRREGLIATENRQSGRSIKQGKNKSY